MKINTFFDFCSGIGGGRLGLEKAGLICVGRSDTSRLSDKTYTILHDAFSEKNFGNLKNILKKETPKYDVLIAGFPCQSFSVIGHKEGFDDKRGQIIFSICEILKVHKPKAFILENVKGLVTHNKGNTLKIIIKSLDNAGYNVIYKVLTTLDYGIPQMRQRVYFVGIRKDLKIDIKNFNCPEKINCNVIGDFLIDEVPISNEQLLRLSSYLKNKENGGKYTINDLYSFEDCILDTRMNDLRIYVNKCPTLRAQRDGIYYVKNHNLYQLTGVEALMLQGFPLEYVNKVREKVSNRHLLMQAGNAMSVNVIFELGKKLINICK